jgi:hypothetical protein
MTLVPQHIILQSPASNDPLLDLNTQPSLDLQFATGKTLNDRVSGNNLITFSRADATTCATYVDSNGVIQTAAANVPRFDHDPVTGESLGLLIEEGRTNLLTYSEQFDQGAWQKYRASVAPNSSVAPDGTFTADKIIEDVGTSEDHIVNRSVSLASTTYSYSFYVKAGERSHLIVSRATANQTSFTHSYTLEDNGTATGGGNIAALSNGWYRCSGQTTLTNTGSGGIAIRLADSSGNTFYNGDGTSGIYLWGAQVEVGSFSTSYIPTTSSTVTRAADVASITGTNFSSWYNQSEGTFYGQASKLGTNTNARLFVTSTGSSTRTTDVYRDTTSTQLALRSGTVGYLLYGGYTEPLTVTAAYKANDYAGSLNGVLAFTGGSGSVLTCDRLTLGNWYTGSYYANGHISRLAYYPYRLADATLQEITS